MHPRVFLFFAAIIIAFAGCDRRPQAEQLAAERAARAERDQAERRLAELRELEQRVADREAAARSAESDLERKKLANERAALEREKERLLDEQRRAEESRPVAERATDEDARANAKQARTDQRLEFFYDALDPQGDWVEVERYGYCWHPTASRNPAWRPYTDGTWAWTDYGWTWVSNEPFGWATYHYGRWTRIPRLGWVWIPGSEWAPAWVAWRRGEQFVGWAPLPPEAHSGNGFTAAVDSYYDIGPSSYAFVAVENFGEPSYVGRVVESQQNITIINKTVNVTNITYQNVQNKVVVHNAGPDPEVIKRRSKQPIRTLRVERVSDGTADGGAERRGDILRLRAPVIQSAAKPATAPKKIKERARADELDRGWGGIDAQSVEVIRAQQTKEARSAEAAQRAPAGSSPAAGTEVPGQSTKAPLESLATPATEKAAPSTNVPTDDQRTRKPKEIKRKDDPPKSVDASEAKEEKKNRAAGVLGEEPAPGANSRVSTSETGEAAKAREAAASSQATTPATGSGETKLERQKMRAAKLSSPVPGATPSPTPSAPLAAPATPGLGATPTPLPRTERLKKSGAARLREKQEKTDQTEVKEN